MSAAVDELAELDVDIEATVPCQAKKTSGCEREGSWHGAYRCCGVGGIVCEEHRRAFEMYVEEKLLLHIYVVCRACKGDFIGIRWRKL